MRVYVYHGTGPAADVLRAETRAIPRPGRGEVLVRVHASGLNPHDVKRRSGWLGQTVPPTGIIPHSDGAGEVVSVGDDVRGRRPGERVMLFGASHGAYEGTAAEYVVLAQQNMLPIPDAMSFDEAAALGIPGLTAWYTALSADSINGRWIVIHGGLGAVGRAAIQMAHWAGAKVIATLSDDTQADTLRALGASHIVNRKHENLSRRILDITGKAGASLVIDVDFGANLLVDADIVAENGRIASYSSSSNRTPTLPYYNFALKGVRLHFIQVTNMPADLLRQASATIQTLLKQGRLKPVITHKLPLSAIVEGHQLLETEGANKKIVYSVP